MSFQFIATHKCDVRAARKLRLRTHARLRYFEQTLTQDQNSPPNFQCKRKLRKQHRKKRREERVQQITK